MTTLALFVLGLLVALCIGALVSASKQQRAEEEADQRRHQKVPK